MLQFSCLNCVVGFHGIGIDAIFKVCNTNKNLFLIFQVHDNLYIVLNIMHIHNFVVCPSLRSRHINNQTRGVTCFLKSI